MSTQKYTYRFLFVLASLLISHSFIHDLKNRQTKSSRFSTTSFSSLNLNLTVTLFSAPSLRHQTTKCFGAVQVGQKTVLLRLVVKIFFQKTIWGIFMRFLNKNFENNAKIRFFSSPYKSKILFTILQHIKSFLLKNHAMSFRFVV